MRKTESNNISILVLMKNPRNNVEDNQLLKNFTPTVLAFKILSKPCKNFENVCARVQMINLYIKHLLTQTNPKHATICD